MKRISLPSILLIFLIVAFSEKTVEGAEPKQTPNIVLCMADDLGWGDVGFNGNRTIQTPHLDAMARNGLTFNRFYAAAPVCSPTRGSALTGRHPYRYGVFYANTGHLRRKEVSLAEALKTLGYTTGHFGKWHLGTLTTEKKDSNRGRPGNQKHYMPPWEAGFDSTFSTEAKVPTWDPLLQPSKNRRRTWWDPVSDPSQAEDYGTAYWSNGREVTQNTRGDDSRVIMDRAIPFIQQAAQNDQPFLAVIWFHAPHLPVVAGPKYTSLYSDEDKYTQHFYGCITAMDEQMGRLRNELRQLNVAENTMLWFCSDNGPEGRAGRAPGSAGPFRGRKRSLFEGGIRVPAVLEWPTKVPSGTVTSFPATTSDYFPTVMDVLEHEVKNQPKPIDGISLLPLLKGRMSERPQPIGFESRNRVALSDNRYKLVGKLKNRGKKKSPAEEKVDYLLFDLQADPAEQQNLADKHPEIVQRMAETLKEWR